MALYNRLIEKVNEEEEQPLGTNDPLKIKPTAKTVGKHIVKQYQKLPEDTRQNIQEGVSTAVQDIESGITGLGEWNKELREQNYWGGVGPLDPLIGIGKAYNAVIEPAKDQLSRATGLDPVYFDLGELGIDLATLNPKATRKLLNKAKTLKELFPSPQVFEAALDPTAIVKYTGTGLDGVNLTNKYAKFGYKGNDLPQQITKLKADKRFTKTDIGMADQSLFKFYNTVKKWEQSGKSLGTYPKYWVNPVTNDIYKVGYKGNRYSLFSKNRYVRTLEKSSIIQKKVFKFREKDIKQINKKLLDEFNEERNELLAAIAKADRKITSTVPGKPGSFREQEVGSAIAVRTQKVKQLEELLESIPYSRDKIPAVFKGTLFYGEHGYGLANERVQTIIKRLGGQFSLGDAKNFHPVLLRGKTKNFKAIKDRFEQIVNKINKGGKQDYPGLTVNYNPNLQKGEQKYIIRLENPDSIRLGGPKGMYPNILHGDAVFEIDILNPPFFLDEFGNPTSRRLDPNSTKSIKDYLKNYYEPNLGPIQDKRKYIPSEVPLTPQNETQRKLLEFTFPDE